MPYLPEFMNTTRPRSSAGRKTPLTPTAAMRKHRVSLPQHCVDTKAKIANLHRLIDATEKEYREAMADLDRLDNEGRAWLVVDFIHKSSLATLDLAASLAEIGGEKVAGRMRMLSDGTQTASDAVIGAQQVARGDMSKADFSRNMANRALTHIPSGGTRGAFMKGTAEVGSTGYENLNRIIGAQGTPQANTRTAEAGVDLGGGLVQRVTEMADQSAIEGGNKDGSPTARKVGALASIARAMASYGRELEGVFDRRLDVRSSLNSSRAILRSSMGEAIRKWRLQVKELEAEMATCEH